jgi:iron complex transport system substrate-binding protein
VVFVINTLSISFLRVVAMLAMLSLFSFAGAISYPLIIKDDLGRSVTIKSEPKRIIVMLPSHTETLFALGVGSRIIGRDDYSNYPAAALKIQSVGGLYNPNLEVILALKPDLVLNSEYGSLTASLEKAGITVWAGSAQTFSDVFNTISVIGKIVNRETAAIKLNTSIRRDISALEQTLRAASKPSVYFEIDPTPYSVGPNSFIGVMLTKVGAKNIIPASLGDFPQVSNELIIKSNPSVILGATLAEIEKRSGWAGIRAVQNKQVFNITGDDNDAVVRAGPRIAVGLRVLAKLLHPDLLK